MTASIKFFHKNTKFEPPFKKIDGPAKAVQVLNNQACRLLLF